MFIFSRIAKTFFVVVFLHTSLRNACLLYKIANSKINVFIDIPGTMAKHESL